MRASSAQKFDILVPRASILLVSVSDWSLTLTKRIEALWTRMEIWGSRFMKLLHKFPYGGPYGPVMWRAFERKGKKKRKEMCFHSLRIFYKKRGDEILGLLWDGVEVFRIKFVFDVSYSSTRFFNCFSLKRWYSAKAATETQQLC